MNYLQIFLTICCVSIALPEISFSKESSSQPIQLNQSFDATLQEALGKIGGSNYDIEVYQNSGELSFALIKAFLYYANNSSKLTFHDLNNNEKNTLIVLKQPKLKQVKPTPWS